MTNNDFSEYFYTQVILPYHEFRQSILSRQFGNKKDRRLALTAAIQLHHLKEHLPTNISVPFDEIAEFNPDFELLGAIANSAKHSTLRNPRYNRLIVGSESIKEYLIICIFEDEEGEYTHVEKAVLAKMVDGSTKDVFYMLTSVMNMWLQLLPQLGLVEDRKLYNYPSVGPVSRKDAFGLHALNMTKGIPSSISVILQRYNYDEARFVNEPIKGGKFNIYGQGNIEPSLTKDIIVSGNEES